MHRLVIFKNKYINLLSTVNNSNRVISIPDSPLFNNLADKRFEILSVNDLIPKTKFYEIDRSYQLRNIFVPILIFGLEYEYERLISLLTNIGLAQKFELKPGYFKYLVLSLDFMSDQDVNSYQKWEDPLIYISHKSSCVYCNVSRRVDAFILKKDYDDYIHKESDVEVTLRLMKESGIYEAQRSKYLNILSSISNSNNVIAVEDHALFSIQYFQQLPKRGFNILPITELIAAKNYSFLLNNILVPIVAFGLHDELGRVVTLLKEKGLAKKFELKPGFFKYLVKESDIASNRFADPISFFYRNRAVSFWFSEGTNVTMQIKDYDTYFLRRKNADNSLWGQQNYTCQYCGTIAEHIDHIIPLSKGGSCELDNLALSCQKCNLRKHDNTPAEAKLMIVRDFPEIDEKWTISSDKYFKPCPIISSKMVSVSSNVKKNCYEITLLDKVTGEIISKHFAESKSEALWKFIELYESINPNYTLDPYSRVNNARRRGSRV